MKAAIITESSGKSVELKESAGIFECLFEHEVKATKAEFNWKGKSIPREMWQEVLAFFKWTQDTEKSEAQVRLFVHPEHGWMAWAFPQKGGTSMTTKEIENEDSRNQRALNIPAGYIAFGTVHHHCTMSAFQSGTDTADEKNVDGLHITVGKMDSKEHDIHCRIYIKGHRFEPDMSAFWDIGQEAAEKVKFVADLGFKAEQLLDKIARTQMCVPAPENHPFNDLWKTNYIVDAPYVHTQYVNPNGPPMGVGLFGGNGGRSGHGDWCVHCSKWVTNHNSMTCRNKSNKKGGKFKNYLTASEVLDELYTKATLMGMQDEEIGAILHEVGDGQWSMFYGELFDLCADNMITPDKLWIELEMQSMHAEKKQAEDEAEETVATDARQSVETVDEAIARMRAEGSSSGWDGYGGM